jgi:hypothetical protein
MTSFFPFLKAGFGFGGAAGARCGGALRQMVARLAVSTCVFSATAPTSKSTKEEAPAHVAAELCEKRQEFCRLRNVDLYDKVLMTTAHPKRLRTTLCPSYRQLLRGAGVGETPIELKAVEFLERGVALDV